MTARRAQELLPELLSAILDSLSGANLRITGEGTFKVERVGRRTLRLREVDTDGSYDFTPDEFFVTVAVNPADL